MCLVNNISVSRRGLMFIHKYTIFVVHSFTVSVKETPMAKQGSREWNFNPCQFFNNNFDAFEYMYIKTFTTLKKQGGLSNNNSVFSDKK